MIYQIDGQLPTYTLFFVCSHLRHARRPGEALANDPSQNPRLSTTDVHRRVLPVVAEDATGPHSRTSKIQALKRSPVYPVDEPEATRARNEATRQAELC